MGEAPYLNDPVALSLFAALGIAMFVLMIVAVVGLIRR